MRKAAIVLLMLSIYAFRPEKNSTLVPYQFPELRFFPPMPTSKENPVTEAGAVLGRYLFYDPILSLDSSISCAGCHRQEAAFSDAPNPLSKGIEESLQHRNTLPLFNLAWYPKLFWDGRAKSLEEQVFHPVRAHNEMRLNWQIAEQRIRESKFYPELFENAFPQQAIDSIRIAAAIAQFERTLISNRSKYDQAILGRTYLTHDERQGQVLMNDQTKGDCLHCHTTDVDVLGTTAGFSNNGLDAAQTISDYSDAGLGPISGRKEDYGKFKIPSLRNVALTAPYMHDGRFTTLEEVLDFYSDSIHASVNVDSRMGTVHSRGAQLSELEKKQIIAFLHTLTDSAFIQDPRFSNPFLKN